MNKDKKFILIDDDETTNLLCRLTIEDVLADADVTDFTDPELALEYMDDLVGHSQDGEKVYIFLDLNMPFLSGWDVLERMKHWESAIKTHFEIYILSSSVNMRDKEQAQKHLLVTDYWEKPLTHEKITSLLEV